ncbi:MAG: transglutaminase-like domain-containing protein [Acidobacteriota bacterium]
MIAEVIRARQVFQEMATLEESVFPLDRAALAIGLEEYPGLDMHAYLRQLNTLAARTTALLGQERSPSHIIDCLNEALFVQEGLRGNTEDYYDPGNSYLNEVLDRKVGIPISLSVIFMEVARRIGFPVQGVGLPGHFIVKHVAGDEEILIDPFNQGRRLASRDCEELLNRVYGGTTRLQPAHLQGMEKKAIISRMLFNLKGIYYQREDHSKALAVVERILMLNPGTPSEVRDRGMLYMQTSLFSKALADLEFYLAQAHAPQDSAHIKGHIDTLRKIVSSTN